MKFVDKIKMNGVVGAGGAGFPTHIKMAAEVDWLLANGAECEPLMCKDNELMIHFADEIIRGMQYAAESVQAKQCVIGIKSKNKEAIHSLRCAIKKSNLSIIIHEFEDYYPAGDEYEIVATITGKPIPAAGIPLDVGAVVCNVESLYNISNAMKNKPVIDKFLTIAGEVKNPITVSVPIGTSYEDLLALAGGTNLNTLAICENGLMMGSFTKDLQKYVTKQTGGIVILPETSQLVKRSQKTLPEMHRIGQSACDQCNYCTELCPRYLLGYDIQPHLVMRSLGFTAMGTDYWSEYASLCCKCGLCTLYACPENLFPREACIQSIKNLSPQAHTDSKKAQVIKLHPMRSSRHVSSQMLMQRLGVTKYDIAAKYKSTSFHPGTVKIPLLQHTGVPAKPIVNIGDKIKRGQLIGSIPEDELGSPIHASIDGTVREIGAEFIAITR
ncbi:MAG: NADH dehydrogenase subunit [Calditrichaeota bacterium]|nr:MAG: NADH dehydrogenase subunit [Calditrichota bacterium]